MTGEMRLALAALFAVAAVAVAGGAVRGATGAGATEIQRGITVSGTGTVTTIPDRAGFAFGVTSRAMTASEALDANGAAMRRVIAALKAAGVDGADIQTAEISLSPRVSDSGEAILGYEVSNTVTAKLRDLGKAGDVIDAAVHAGADTVSGPSLFKSDQDALVRDALKTAVADARAKAEAIAAAANVQLGRVTSVVEGGAQVPVPIAADRAAPAATPVEPGTTELQATVTVTFSIA
jgi:uncharacterized protein